MTAHWAWPQYVAVGLYVFNLVVVALIDGQPKKGNNSFAITAVVIAFGAWILWCGGFFS